MGTEIERKFLVVGNEYKRLAEVKLYRQGYISDKKGKIVRVRLMGKRGLLTVKGEISSITCPEYEYEIPYDDALFMIENISEKPIIEKYRYTTHYEGFKWEIDEFLGENKGLIIAEIELPSEEQEFCKPPWIGEEVTGIPKYYNANLIKNPYSKW